MSNVSQVVNLGHISIQKVDFFLIVNELKV